MPDIGGVIMEDAIIVFLLFIIFFADAHVCIEKDRTIEGCIKLVMAILMLFCFISDFIME